MELGETISLAVGIIGTGVAIYQWAVLNEGKKRKRELQYIIAGINSAALQKQQAWQNQISLISKPKTPAEWETVRLYVRAKDDFAEIASLTVALEGTIDVEGSAISDMMDKYLANVKKNNELQAEGLKNPTLKKEN